MDANNLGVLRKLYADLFVNLCLSIQVDPDPLQRMRGLNVFKNYDECVFSFESLNRSVWFMTI